jgi:hypothetical protein
VLLIVFGQVCEGHAFPKVPFIDLDLLPFHFRPSRSLGRKVAHGSNRNLLFDPLAVGLPSCAEKQHPSFAVFASFFL